MYQAGRVVLEALALRQQALPEQRETLAIPI